jgi:hypothetical protein
MSILRVLILGHCRRSRPLTILGNPPRRRQVLEHFCRSTPVVSMIFGVREISFHNYTISKDQTWPKDENLCPMRNMSTPKSVTELMAFLGCTQQMSQYCRYYGIVASPLHRLTRVTEPFPKHWLPGTDYDIAFHRIKTTSTSSSQHLSWRRLPTRWHNLSEKERSLRS